jgi:hypothetical protein
VTNLIHLSGSTARFTRSFRESEAGIAHVRFPLVCIFELASRFSQNGFHFSRFLTLFTARFPLPFVFQCIDLFLLDGINVLFQIAFALLSVCRKDLLSKDFESMLKYIRVSLPKKFRAEAQVTKLIKLASECKVKKLKKYEEEFMTQKEENEKFERMLSQYQMKYNEDRKMMQSEILQLQQRVKKFEIDEKKFENIIQDYKLIIQRQEQQLESMKSFGVSQPVKPKFQSNLPSLPTEKQRKRND